MEIIDELEPVKRGVYGGAVGYLAWNGNMDTAIAIRTAVIKDDKLYIEAGGRHRCRLDTPARVEGEHEQGPRDFQGGGHGCFRVCDARIVTAPNRRQPGLALEPQSCY